MTGPGDIQDADVFDTEPPDPEQVARKLHAVRLEAGLERLGWLELVDVDREIRIEVVGVLLRWLRRQGGIR